MGEKNKMYNMALEVSNLSKKFDGFSLSNISFKIEKGSIMGFIGENGAGKTTTMKLILNAFERDGGEIKVFGLDNIQNEREIKQKIGYAADEDCLCIGSTLGAHAKAYAKIFKNWDEKLFKKYVELWNLPLKKKLTDFSKGMKMKAMLALAFARRPELLLLDEPAAGLDPVARIELLDILRDFVADGERSVLISSHITSDLDKAADYITLIIDGEIAESEPLDILEEKYALISGSIDDLRGKEHELVGVRKGEMTFDALVLREKLKLFPGVAVHTPNLENILTFSIWGRRERRRKV